MEETETRQFRRLISLCELRVVAGLQTGTRAQPQSRADGVAKKNAPNWSGRAFLQEQLSQDRSGLSSNKYNALEHKQVWRCQQLRLLEQQGACRVPVDPLKAYLIAWTKLAQAGQIRGDHVVLKSLVSLSRSKPLSIRSDGTGHPMEASYQGTSSFVPPLAPN